MYHSADRYRIWARFIPRFLPVALLLQRLLAERHRLPGHFVVLFGEEISPNL
jgi:hypothetical protein